MPDGDFDYERLDPGKTYAGVALPDLTLDQLRATLEQLPCCATNADGDAEGDPLNIVLVGEPNEVLNSLTRSGWSFTHRITLRTVRREIGAAVEGKPYSVAPVSSLYVFGRQAGRRDAAGAPLDLAAQPHAPLAGAVHVRAIARCGSARSAATSA